MALPQFNSFGVNGQALETFGFEADDNTDGMGLLMFGLIWPVANIWNACSVTASTTWSACSITATTTWNDLAVTASTTWTES